MSSRIFFAIAPSLAVFLAACGGDQPAPETENEAAETSEVAPVELYDASTLTAAIEGPWRSEEARARDQFRNPAETLSFFEIDPASTVVEVWPGGGWYTDILAPWIAANGGQYIAAWTPIADGDTGAQSFQDRFMARFDEDVFGTAQLVEFGPGANELAEPDSVDAIVTFRNIHSVLRRGFAETAFESYRTALKPGGVLGVVAHRQPAGAVQDPRTSNGYVQQDYVIALATEAGLEFVGSSEINANSADTADHPFGVWTLPPVLRNAAFGEEADPDFDSERYRAIGESDRMTLLFRRPDADVTPAGDSE